MPAISTANLANSSHHFHLQQHEPSSITSSRLMRCLYFICFAFHLSVAACITIWAGGLERVKAKLYLQADFTRATTCESAMSTEISCTSPHELVSWLEQSLVVRLPRAHVLELL